MDYASAVEALECASRGETGAVDALLPRVYDELRGIAARLFHVRDGTPTLAPTAVVNEAYVRIVGSPDLAWDARTHFVGIAAKVMRQVIIDHHRERQAQKRGGGWGRVTLSELPDEPAPLDFTALHEALAELEALDERQARVIELRFFGGLAMQPIADLLGVSIKTIELDWRHARAWLTNRLRRA